MCRLHVMKRSGYPLLLLSMALGGEAALMPRQNLQYSIEFNAASLTLGESSIVDYTSTLSTGNTVQKYLNLLLLQTSAGAGVAVSSANVVTLDVVQPDICITSSDLTKCGTSQFPTLAGLANVLVGVKETASYNSTFDSTNNLFFCIATAARSHDNAASFDICNFYSNVFNLVDGSAVNNAGADAQTKEAPTGAMTITSSVTTIIQLLQTQTAITSQAITANVPVSGSPVSTSIISTSYSTLTTMTSTPTSVTSSVSAHSTKSSGLSVGAKVGIALGALVVVGLGLLAILFCLRRKHSKRNDRRALDPSQPPEQVMLTRSMHTDSFGNGGGRSAILAEKEEASSSATALHQNLNSPDSSPIHEHSHSLDPQALETRHTTVSPYVPLPSLPYSGTAATIPRRKPTSATLASTVSRNLSTSSAISSNPISPRSQTSRTQGSDEFSPYHDVPIYGDARHVPQVFSGNERALGGASSPFVTEEMTAEEVARLEEEERRIDAAIAEAERR